MKKYMFVKKPFTKNGATFTKKINKKSVKKWFFSVFFRVIEILWMLLQIVQTLIDLFK